MLCYSCKAENIEEILRLIIMYMYIPLTDEVVLELALVVLGVRFTPADSRSCFELPLLPKIITCAIKD